MNLLEGFWPASQETQAINEFQVVHRLGDLYEVSVEVIWIFQLISYPVVFFLIWIKVAESGA